MIPTYANLEFNNINGILQIKIINSNLWIVLPNGSNLDFQPTGCNAKLPDDTYDSISKTFTFNSASYGILTGGLFRELILWFDNYEINSKLLTLENKVKNISFGDTTKNTLIETINYEEIVANKYRNEKYGTTYWITKIPYKPIFAYNLDGGDSSSVVIKNKK